MYDTNIEGKIQGELNFSFGDCKMHLYCNNYENFFY